MLSSVRTQPSRLVYEDLTRLPAHPFAFDSTADRVSTCGLFRFRNGDFTLARSCRVVRLATCRESRSRCVRPISASQHSLTSTRTRLLPAHHLRLTPKCVLGGLRPSRPRNRTFHDARIALGDRQNPWGVFFPSRALRLAPRNELTIFPLTPLSPPSLAPRHRVCGARLGEGRQIVSTPFAMTRSKISRSEVPSLGK